MNKKLGALGRLALFSAALIWGTSFVILKAALGNVGTMWTLSIRFTLSTLIMLSFGWKRLRDMDRRSLRGSVMMGACLAAAYIFQTYGLVYTSPGKMPFLPPPTAFRYRFSPGLSTKESPVFSISAPRSSVSRA